MNPCLHDELCTVYNTDARNLIRLLPESGVDAVVTDPPYELGLGTAGRVARWDSTGIAFDPAFWTDIMTVMKPGAFLLAFGSPRTWHRLACAIEDGGLTIRDQLCWLYSSGMPKGEWGDHAVDRALGLKDGRTVRGESGGTLRGRRVMEGDYHAQSEQAAAWAGYNPALKPAWEPILVAQRPRETMLGRNLLDHGTGALHVAACALDADMDVLEYRYERNDRLRRGDPRGRDTFRDTSTPRRALPRLSGRYPSDLIMEAGLLGADVARFYYCPKASGADRPDVDATLMVPTDRTRWTAHAERLGLDPNAEDYPDMLLDRDAMAVCRPAGTVRLAHPTVKPSDLMRWLARLACPAGGLVLDPFLGSGSTLSAARMEGLRCVGTELDTHYLPLIRERMAEPAGQPLF